MAVDYFREGDTDRVVQRAVGNLDSDSVESDFGLDQDIGRPKEVVAVGIVGFAVETVGFVGTADIVLGVNNYLWEVRAVAGIAPSADN